MKFVFRLVLFLLGLVLAVSLSVAVLLLALVWGARYGWARLTCRPVTPWGTTLGGRFKSGAVFNRFRRAADTAESSEPTAADTINARARGESVEQPVRIRGLVDDVSDVQSKPASGR